jgi:hypothetical protein
MISIDTLKKLFSKRPQKSTITFKGKCSDCGCDVTINIATTSGGFGLLGGFLFEHEPDWYCTKCPDCYEANPILSTHYSHKYRCTIVK